MKKSEFDLLIEVALAVRDMAGPDAKRAIERRINSLQDEDGRIPIAPENDS